MADPNDDDETVSPDADPPSRSGAPSMPYPGALDERLLTPRAPLPPGAGITVFPPVMDPFPGTSPAAWAADPTGRHQWRWWNGITWTDHVADDGEASEDPLLADP